MAYDISTLPAYVDQTDGNIIAKSLLSAKTATLIRKMPGVKGSKTVNIIDQPVTFQSDACGFTAIDSTPLTQRTLTVGAIKSDKSYCPHTLDGTYVQQFLPSGSYQTSIPFEQFLLDLEAGYVAQQLEVAIWQSDLSAGAANLNKFDGLLKIISGATSATGVTQFTGTNFASSAMSATIDSVYAALPAQIRTANDVAIIMGIDSFVNYTIGLKNQNLYHFDPSGKNQEYTYPGDQSVKIYGVAGLNGTNKIVGARLSNLVYGFDAEADSAQAKIWYSQDNNEVRSTIKFKAGTQIGIPSEIIYFR